MLTLTLALLKNNGIILKIPNVSNNFKFNCRYKVTHSFKGYKYTGHYTNLKIIDPNLERYSPLILIPKKGYNRFSVINQISDSIPLKVTLITIFSVTLTALCFTEKHEWKSYNIANKIFYYVFKPFMEIIAFTLNLNVEGPKIEVPDKIAYHRDSDCEIVTNLDFLHKLSESSIDEGTDTESDSVDENSEEFIKNNNNDVEPIKSL